MLLTVELELSSTQIRGMKTSDWFKVTWDFYICPITVEINSLHECYSISNHFASLTFLLDYIIR